MLGIVSNQGSINSNHRDTTKMAAIKKKVSFGDVVEKLEPSKLANGNITRAITLKTTV
jgi:hypothetical protein